MTDFGGAASYPSPPTHFSPPGRKPSLGSLYEQTQSMSSSSSPQHAGNGPPEKGPLQSLNLGFLKSLTEKRTTRDGQPAKRRGPKPDSKPALTRRQELNRQAQRTHRERKELYIKALEDEVLRLREVYTNVTQEKDKLVDENKQLRTLLHQNGLPVSTASPGGMDEMMSNPSLGYTSSGSVSGSYAAGSATAYTPPLTSQSTAPSVSVSSQMIGGQSHHHARNVSQQHRVDYDQAGIDFVLTLEKPCMDHMPWLIERANETGGEACGHALMASCPPEPFHELSSDVPFGHVHHRHSNQNQNQNQDRDNQMPQTWSLSKGDLATLLDLSKKLDLDGEITPVMAWGIVLAHPRLSELKADDFQKLMDELKGKVRCYGFGAVLEEFEVRDALSAILSSKPDMHFTY